MSEPLRLHPADLEQLADLIVAKLAPAAPGRLLTASEAAERLGVTREWLYDHADQLQAVRLGTGPKARLRFDPEQVTAALQSFDAGKGSQPPDPAPPRASRRRASRATAGGNQLVPELLPIRGVGGAL